MSHNSESGSSQNTHTPIRPESSITTPPATLSCCPQPSSANTCSSAVECQGQERRIDSGLSASPSHEGSQRSLGSSDTETIYSDANESQASGGPLYDETERIPIPIRGNPWKSWNDLRERATRCQEQLKSLADTAIFKHEGTEEENSKYRSIISTCLSDIGRYERYSTVAVEGMKGRWDDWINDGSEKDLTDPAVLRKIHSFNLAHSYMSTIGSSYSKGFQEYVDHTNGRFDPEKEWVHRGKLANSCQARDLKYGIVEKDLLGVEGVLSRQGSIANSLGALRSLYSTDNHVRSYWHERPARAVDPGTYREDNPPGTKMLRQIGIDPYNPSRTIMEWDTDLNRSTCDDYDRGRQLVEKLGTKSLAS